MHSREEEETSRANGTLRLLPRPREYRKKKNQEGEVRKKKKRGKHTEKKKERKRIIAVNFSLYNN